MMPTQCCMPHWHAKKAVGAILGPHQPVGAIVPVVILEAWKNALQESRLVNI